MSQSSLQATPMTRRQWLIVRQAAIAAAGAAWPCLHRPGSGSTANRLAVIGRSVHHPRPPHPDCHLCRCCLHRIRPIIGDLGESARLLPPGAGHWLGTDDQGRDILSRLIYGSRLTLQVVLLVAVIAAPIGLLVGTVAGYAGGWVDAVLMRITDIFLAFPKLVLALAFVAALGPGIGNAIIAIAITSWPPYARIARAETLMVRNSDYIQAVQLMGASPWRIVLRHIMPLCISSLIVRVTLDMAGIILTAAGLGFLGLGAQPPLPEWGAMIASGRRFILDQWWVAAAPGVAILIVSLGFNLLGDGLRDALDPRGERPMSALLNVEDLRVTFPTRTACHRGGARRVLHARPRAARHCRRERLRQVADRPRHHGPDRRTRVVIDAKRLNFNGIDLTRPSKAERRASCAASRIAMILQDPKYSLNPVMTIGRQIVETLRAHEGRSARRGPRTQRSPCSSRADPRSRPGLRSLSARGLGRHGPARDDRDDADRRARTPDRRRADLGARRHGAARRARHPRPIWSPSAAWG